MRKALLFLIFVLLISCRKEPRSTTQFDTDLSTVKVSGQELFEGEGNCIACHKPDQKIIGPSLEQIARTYKEKKGNIVLFLKEEADPIVDPGQYDIMKTNFAITKTMSDEELEAIEDYIYSFSK